jgi:hypothetical protein
MTRSYHLTRRFSQLYGAAGVWGIAGGGALTLASGLTLFGLLLIAGALVLLVLVATGRVLREKDFTGSDLFFLFLPIVGVVLIALIYFLIFPWSYLVIAYVVVFLILGVLAAAEARRSVT